MSIAKKFGHEPIFIFFHDDGRVEVVEDYGREGGTVLERKIVGNMFDQILQDQKFIRDFYNYLSSNKVYHEDKIRAYLASLPWYDRAMNIFTGAATNNEPKPVRPYFHVTEFGIMFGDGYNDKVVIPKHIFIEAFNAYIGKGNYR